MNVQRVLAWSSAAAVAAAVAAALWIAGSPAEQRLLRLDEQRLSDLMRLTRALDAYWQENERLPARLDELVDGRRLSRLPADPAGGAAYEYRVAAPAEFELCAEFSRPSTDDTPVQDFWHHEEGRHCYAFDLLGGRAERP